MKACTVHHVFLYTPTYSTLYTHQSIINCASQQHTDNLRTHHMDVNMHSLDHVTQVHVYCIKTVHEVVIVTKHMLLSERALSCDIPLRESSIM